MASRLGQPPKVTQECWVAAALSTMSVSGLSEISVEGLAGQLHISKGSFYGYFSSRDDLIAQGLQLWKDQREEVLIQPLRQIVDPHVRFRALTDSSIHAEQRVNERQHLNRVLPLAAIRRSFSVLPPPARVSPSATTVLLLDHLVN